MAPELGFFERIYVRLFGFPALGLRVRAKSILPLMSSLPAPQTVLDAGCGKGVLTLAAARMFPGATVVGADVSADLILRNAELSRRLHLQNVRFLLTDLTQLDEPDAYDLILATDVLEHVDDDRDLLRRFVRALRPGGRLLLHVPHVTRHAWGWTRLNFLDIEGHVRPGYGRAQLWQLLDAAGFRVESASYNYGSLETLMNDLSHWITGGRERHKWAYALCFPFLLLVSWLASGSRATPGSGLVFVARRPQRHLTGGAGHARRAA
ncbi:MAG TPA: class I SAM-dependent methyltransferase [Mycobacterium sp.]|nr:class I SAM-dependent methyltransferase [Mycobacterium sp.]